MADRPNTWDDDFDNEFFSEEEAKESDSVAEAISVAINAKWIPCSIRMPDVPGLYICTVESEWRPVRIMEFKPCKWHKDSNKWLAVGVDNDYYVFNWFVLAWMPLPEPYKEESRKNEE